MNTSKGASQMQIQTSTQTPAATTRCSHSERGLGCARQAHATGGHWLTGNADRGRVLLDRLGINVAPVAAHECSKAECGHGCSLQADGSALRTIHFDGFDADDQPCECDGHEAVGAA
jgi:hypothetical protein